MSTISGIFGSYQEALDLSRQQFVSLYHDRTENGRQFYDAFFSRLIIPFEQRFSSDAQRQVMRRHVERFFGTTDVDFVAIDGTCSKDPFNDFVVFYGGAYGARGRLSLAGDPPKVRYEKWEIDRDVSMVAWVPVPFAQLSDVTQKDERPPEETFIVSDADRVNLASIHTMLMQLAEIFLAYNVANATEIGGPRLIMLDQSLSSVLAAASHGANTTLLGYPYDRRELDPADVTVAMAHPFNEDLAVPSTKAWHRHDAVLAQFDRRNVTEIRLADLETSLGLSPLELKAAIRPLVEGIRGRTPLCEVNGDSLKVRFDVRQSWQFTVSLFENICRRLFLDKDQSALMYEGDDPTNPSVKRRRWMSPDDIAFLIAVGLRSLVETCWRRKILLVGVVKDSESRFLTRNYLGVAKHVGIYPELQTQHVAPLPWTDRIYLESVPVHCDERLNAPWASIEFDSTFMTLSLKTDREGRPFVSGVRVQGGEIVAPERLFARSLAQFFVSRRKKTPLCGHVVFLDRLAYPAWDKSAITTMPISTPSLGQVRPLVYQDAEVANVGQTLMMYLLATLTRNHFPEVIGYPDPLHKADWGAKSIGRRVHGLIRSSEIPFRVNPIARTVRATRDARGR